MKIALVIEAAGAPSTMASTAFAGALMDGLLGVGADAMVFGLARDEAAWLPESLGPCRSSAPWLSPPPPRLADRVIAARMGVFDDGPCDDGTALIGSPDWHLELLLQRALEAFAEGSSDGVLMVYPRSHAWFMIAVRIAARLGWRVMAFSTEALSDSQIDPTTRTSYIRCVSICADAIWAVSSHLAGFWTEHGVSPERIIVVPPMVRAGNLVAAVACPKPHSAVYIGSLAHREIDYLLEIAQLVRSRIPDFSLTIYGDAAEARRQALTSEVAAAGLANTIVVEQPVAPLRVPEVLQHAQVLLLPRASGEFSTAGFPNKLGEYMASGRPAVVTGVGDIPAYLTSAKEVVIVPPDDCTAFAEATSCVLSNPAFGERVGAAGREYAERNLRADIVAARVVEFVRGVPKNGRCRTVRTRTTLRLLRMARATIDAEDLKRAVVRALRALGLKPPAPPSESE